MSFYKEVPGRKTTLESTLKFDTEPKADSTNPVTSEGVKSAIDGAVGYAAENLQEQIDDIAEKAGSGYTPKGPASVATMNGLSGQENGWLYTMTDAGTLTDGSLAVVAGDTVAWDATNSVWYKAMDYAPRQYGTNEVHNLPTTITDFRDGDAILVDGPNGPANMSKNDLLMKMGKTSRLVISKAFINSSVSSGYPTYDSSTTRVCCEDIVIFPKTTAKYKYFAPEGLQFSMEMYKASQSGVGGAAIGWKSNGYEFTHTAEDANNCYAYRLSFRYYGNLPITANEVLNLINAGKVYFEVEGEVDLDYTKSENYTAVESARKKLITSSPWCKNLPLIAHVSDIHGDITRMRNARKIADFFGTSALVNSGDSVMYYGKARCNFLKEYSDENKPLIYCIGNHESYPTGRQTLYEDFIQSLVSLNGYKKNASDAADNCYYFRDLATEKIRFITLNYYNGGVYAGSLGQAQLEWFVATLASTPEGYGVIVVVHSPEDRVECPEALQTFWQKERVVTYQEDGFYIGNRPIMKIIDAFISKSSGTESYTDSTDGEVSVDYDFTSLNTDVEFICYMTGHRHEDWVGYYSNATNKQLSLGITTGCALNSMYNNTAWNNQSDLGRGDGSGPSQDAVNIYAIDRDKGEIRIVRIGANITTSLEERDVLIIPYRD